ncbi:nuclear factor kappa-B-binding-like protein [Tanacetum coccineum]
MHVPSKTQSTLIHSPLSQNPSDQYHEAVNEATSPDTWGLPHRLLVKLVDSFANWSKHSKNPYTITQSSKEVKDYFRKEELIRYLIPDKAFAYTALDGKKSTVAPIRKGPGTPFSKAREHFMLKRGRPSNASILCLVRDAAARLPGSIRTRTDVCTLIRDSQYIVEDVSDAHLSDIVGKALDRLHYERDPCLQFDGGYEVMGLLHREREEVDFEDDGMLSTKRWKRQKNESDINLVPDMKELPECCDGKQHMKIDVVASNMCVKDRVNQVSSLARQPMRKLLS